MNKFKLVQLLNKLELTVGETVMDKKVKESINELILDVKNEAINYTHCCEKLKDKETPTLKDAFIAGYKKRALMSGLKYDEVSELNAITNFKCWKSFDLNL